MSLVARTESLLRDVWESADEDALRRMFTDGSTRIPGGGVKLRQGVGGILEMASSRLAGDPSPPQLALMDAGSEARMHSDALALDAAGVEPERLTRRQRRQMELAEGNRTLGAAPGDAERPEGHPRSLLFYGSVTDFCDLQCQRRFVAEYFVRPAVAQVHATRKGNEWPSTTSTNSGVAIAPTF